MSYKYGGFIDIRATRPTIDEQYWVDTEITIVPTTPKHVLYMVKETYTEEEHALVKEQYYLCAYPLNGELPDTSQQVYNEREIWRKYDETITRDITTDNSVNAYPAYSSVGHYTAQPNSGIDLTIVSVVTDIPIFNGNDSTSIQKYINSGEIENNINSDYSHNWRGYIDGTKNPNIKLTWTPTKEENDYTDTIVKIGVSKDLKNTIDEYVLFNTVQYNDGSIKTTFNDLAYIADINLFNQIISSLVGNTLSSLYLAYQTISTKGKSVLCYVKLNNDGTFEDVSTPQLGSNIWFMGTGEEDDNYVGGESDNDDNKTDTDGDGIPDIEENDDITKTEPYTTVGVLSTTYAMTRDRLESLGNFLWSGDFMDNIKLVNNSPIENIVSCKMLPFSLSGTDEEIVLGNVTTGVNGSKISNYSPRKTVGSIKVTKYYNSFLDYSPFTKLNIFLPFIGFKSLDTSKYMNKTMTVEYIYDIITGACKAVLSVNGVEMDEFDGVCGIDIPITSSNRASVEVGYISSALGSIAQVASGNVLGAGVSALNGAISQYHTQTQGSYSPSCGAGETRTVYLIYDRPTFQDLAKFNHVFGRKCNLSLTIKNLNGFTKCFNTIDTSSIPCTDTERDEIVEILSTGFFA